ncbi:MAG: PaaI family thioesterase, partial [Alphaproteobacteria bacterium]
RGPIPAIQKETRVPDVGFRKWHGLDYEVMTDTKAVVSIDLDADKVNVRGVAHGGVVASLVDVAMGTAAGGGNYDTRKRLVATQELKVNYLAGAKGARLTATATVVRAGSRSIVVTCDVVTDTGIHCATALGTFMTRRVAAGDPDRFQPADD